MERKICLLLVILLFVVQGFALADRPMDKDEILGIFQILINQQKETWIPAGTVEATHLEYRA